MKDILPGQHVEGLVDHALQVTEVLQSGVTLTIGCFVVRIEEMLVMRHSVVAIFIEGTKQFLKTLLDTVCLERKAFMTVGIYTA